MKTAFGVDIGGTEIKFGAFSPEGELLEKWSIKTDLSDNGNKIIPSVAENVKAYAASHGMTLEELIGAFQDMCTVSVGEPDGLLFETGTYDFTGEKLFYFTLARQFQFMDDNEYVQLRMNVLFLPTAATRHLYSVKWGNQTKGDFWGKVQRSRAYKAVKDLPIYKVEILVEDT